MKPSRREIEFRRAEQAYYCHLLSLVGISKSAAKSIFRHDREKHRREFRVIHKIGSRMIRGIARNLARTQAEIFYAESSG